MTKRQKAAAILFLCLVSLLVSFPLFADVQARLDRTSIYEGDQLTLFLESNNTQSGEPDLTPLASDFKILGKNTSTQVTIVNGKRSDKTSWRVGLEPLRLGKLQIPPISIGNEQTQPLDVTVSKVPEQVAAQQAQQLFLEAEADRKEKNYVQQQIPYRVRLYHDGSLIGGELSEPQIENAVIERLGDESKYTTTRNGRRYNVIERRYVISPERSGELQIPAITFKGEIAAAQNTPGNNARRDSFVDQFFRNTPFGNDPFFRNRAPGKPIRTRSNAITVNILPRPGNQNRNWLPAEEISLHDSWTENPPQLRAGEPVTRTITVQARGLTGTQIPELQPAPPVKTRLYPEQPVNESRTDGNKVFGISRQTFTYIPNSAGKLTVPALELDWWNTDTNQQETARLQQWEVTVAPGTGGTETGTQSAPTPADSANKSTEQRRNESRQQPSSSLPGEEEAINWWWLLLLLVLPLLYLLFRNKADKQQPNENTPSVPLKPESRHPDIKASLQLFEQACMANNASEAANRLLLVGESHWHEDPPRSLGTLASRLEGDAASRVMELDRVLYAADASSWNGNKLWNALHDTWSEKPLDKKSQDDELEPLYPERA